MRPVHRVAPKAILAALGALLLLALATSLVVGPTRVAPSHLFAIVIDPDGVGAARDLPPAERVIFWSLRLPRALLCVVVGMALGSAGAAAQGLFRNPLADPGLVGVSSGAALGAAASIVLAGPVLATLPPWARAAAMPLAAFGAGAVTTFVVARLGATAGRASTATVLLAGVAINALAGAFVGLLSHVASDAQLRNITFWTLGGFGGATWIKVALTLLALAVSVGLLVSRARELDVFALGELDARLLGVNVERLRRTVIAALALGVGAAVAAAGLVGFVGLIVPHLVRFVAGPRHRLLVPASALAGGVLVAFADSVARTAVAPAELPIGLLTAALGAPFFLHLLRREVRRT